MITPPAEVLARLRALGTAQVAASRAVPRHPHVLPTLVAHGLLAPRAALAHLLELPRAHGSMRGMILAELVPWLDPPTCLEAVRAIRARDGGWGHWGSASLATAVLDAGGGALIATVLDEAVAGPRYNAPFSALARLPDGAARAAALIEVLTGLALTSDDADEVVDEVHALITAAPAQVPLAPTRALLDAIAARLTAALPFFDSGYSEDPRLQVARASLALVPVAEDPGADLARALAMIELTEGAPYPFGAPPPPPGASFETVALRRAILAHDADGDLALRERATAPVGGATTDTTWIPFLDGPAIDALLERDLAALSTDPWHAPTRLTNALADLAGDTHRARRQRIAEAIAALGLPTEQPGVWQAHAGFLPLTAVARDLAPDSARALLADLLRWGERAEAARDAPLPAHDRQAGAFLGAALALADAADDGAALTALFDRRPAYLIEVIREPAMRARWLRLCAPGDRARWLRAIPALCPPAIDPAEALTMLVALAAPASAAGRDRARPLAARLLAAITDGGARLTLLRRLASVALIEGDHARELEARLAAAPPLEIAWAIDDLAAAMPHLPPVIAPAIARRLLAHAPGSRFTSGDTHYQTRAVVALVAALGDSAAAVWQDLGLPTATAAISIVPAPLRDAEIARRCAAAPGALEAHAAWASHGSRGVRDAAFARLVAAAEADPAIDPGILYPFTHTADEPELLRLAALLRARDSIHVSAWLARAMAIGATEAIAALAPPRFRTSFEGEAPNAWTLAAHALDATARDAFLDGAVAALGA
ncbi:MAG: hypothetical protein K8W52_35845 [Deltaproteobacteria bacterium]|nr:hypothetical protein [Deltaproteobacteria bacterium]